MLANLVGVFDVPSALVMIAFFVGSGIVIASILAKKTHQEIDNDFEIKKATLQRDYEINKLKLNQNLITSHRSDT